MNACLFIPSAPRWAFYVIHSLASGTASLCPFESAMKIEAADRNNVVLYNVTTIKEVAGKI